MSSLLRRGSTIALAVGALISTSLFSFAAVDPATVDDFANPGDSWTISKTVTTPEIPPKPDIVLLADNTGSMGSYINSVKADMASIVGAVQGEQPDAQFAVATYMDYYDGADLFRVRQDLTGDATAITTAVNGIFTGDGGDAPEAQLHALQQVASGAITWRADSSRIVVWFGDQPGHDPSVGTGETLASATAALVAAEARVLAIDVGILDSTGQATAITTATGGSLVAANAATIADAILEGLSNLPVDVTPAAPSCDAGLSVTFDVDSRTVISGEDAVFQETITVAADAEQGATLTCTTDFNLNGEPGGEGFVQTVSIYVNDVTPPTVMCDAGPNPDGVITTQAIKNGFYTLNASDNLDGVMVTVTDMGTGTTFGDYAPGTTMKLTKASGTDESSVTPGSGAVDWQFKFQGNALVTATDAAGLTDTAICKVPSAKK